LQVAEKEGEEEIFEIDGKESVTRKEGRGRRKPKQGVGMPPSNNVYLPTYSNSQHRVLSTSSVSAACHTS